MLRCMEAATENQGYSTKYQLLNSFQVKTLELCCLKMRNIVFFAVFEVRKRCIFFCFDILSFCFKEIQWFCWTFWKNASSLYKRTVIFIWLKHTHINSKIRETDNFAVVSFDLFYLFFPELYMEFDPNPSACILISKYHIC